MGDSPENALRDVLPNLPHNAEHGTLLHTAAHRIQYLDRQVSVVQAIATTETEQAHGDDVLARRILAVLDSGAATPRGDMDSRATLEATQSLIGAVAQRFSAVSGLHTQEVQRVEAKLQQLAQENSRLREELSSKKREEQVALKAEERKRELATEEAGSTSPRYTTSLGDDKALDSVLKELTRSKYFAGAVGSSTSRSGMSLNSPAGRGNERRTSGPAPTCTLDGELAAMMEQLVDAQVESRAAEAMLRVNRDLTRRLEAANDETRSLREANHQLGIDVQGGRTQLMQLYEVVGELSAENEAEKGLGGLASLRASLAIQRQELVAVSQAADLAEASLEDAREETKRTEEESARLSRDLGATKNETEVRQPNLILVVIHHRSNSALLIVSLF